MHKRIPVDNIIYCGLADCHGIESFLPESQAKIGHLQIREIANPQRWAVTYKVGLDKTQVKCIEDLLDEQNFKLALKMLKSFTKDLKVSSRKRWKAIPNSKLDPYA